MTNEKIKTAAEVVTGFLDDQAKDEDLDPSTVKTVGALRDEGKLTKVNLLRQLEVLRKAAINVPADEGGADD
ncbi:hypothetical protein [Aliiroseovarius crassostreae]|uniref:hypothetical protein n=1 Tax=Aliiroseovarius crassostreae TaxID=154981 RepID=UPI00220CB8B8|nr:hypothetical protein [Aliiroseovarius crassostreae]UWQ09681.1 hypothetical protein K3X25_15800 [Aliiroseovarius crassostreae]